MQTDFAAALLDPARAAPAALIGPDGQPAGRRFGVYRNNVAVSLTEALRATFPVVEALLGAEYFAALAGVFLRESPPDDRRLMLYGAALPDFLAGFPPLAHLPYLPDVARLEHALGASYHAADATALPPENLAALTPEAFLASRLILAPSLRLVRSDWPVVSIWQAHQPGGTAPPLSRPESALVLRAGFDSAPHLLPPGGGAFLAALLAGRSVAGALEAAPDLALDATLALLIGQGAIIDLNPGEFE